MGGKPGGDLPSTLVFVVLAPAVAPAHSLTHTHTHTHTHSHSLTHTTTDTTFAHCVFYPCTAWNYLYHVHASGPRAPPLGMRSAVPIGGMGTGTFELRGDGEVRDWLVENQVSSKLHRHESHLECVGIVKSGSMLTSASDWSRRLWSCTICEVEALE